MRKEYIYLLASLAALGGVIVWVGLQKADFEVVGRADGLPPGVRTLTIRVKEELPLEKIAFSIEPEDIPILGLRSTGDQTLMLVLGAPLEPGKSYTLRATRGLRGKRSFKVLPLRVQVTPTTFHGPNNEPALLFTANGSLFHLEVPLRNEQGNSIQAQRVALSDREALYLLKSPAPVVEVPNLREERYELKGERLRITPTPFTLRESVVEEESGRLRVRLRFSHWIEGRIQDPSLYISIADGIPFTTEVRGIDLYLYPETRPSGPFQVVVRAGFPGIGPTLSDTEKLLLSPKGESLLSWHQPYVHFVSPGTPILFQAKEEQEASISIWRVLPQNIRLFFRQKAEGLWMNYTSDLEGWGGSWWGEDRDMPSYAEVVRKMTLSPKLLRKVKHKGQTLYAIGEDLPPGIYVIQIQSSWETIHNWFIVGSYGLIARRGADGLHLWAVLHKGLSPLGGVEIEVWGPAGQVLGRGTTDRKGKVLLPIEASADIEGVWAIWNGEPNYLPLRGLRPGRWTFETGGLDVQQSGLLCYFTAARTVFRPGEKVEIAGALRTALLQYPALKKLWGRFRDPLGRLIREVEIPCTSDGSWTWSYTLSLSAPTGSYQLELLTASDGELIATFPLRVEAFRPNRLSVQVQGAVREKQLSLQTHVSYLYGAPGSALTGEIRGHWKPLSPLGEGDYEWLLALPEEKLREALSNQVRTDRSGEAQSSLPLPKGWGYGELKVIAEFIDDEGRPNRGVASFPVFTQPYLVGMRKLPPYVKGGTTLSVPLKVLSTPQLKASTNPVSIRAEVIERHYEPLLVEQPWGGYRQEYRPIERLYLRTILETQRGEGLLSFTPQRGEYEIRLWAPEQSFPTVQKVEVWEWGGESLLASDPEGGIELHPQKPTYTMGETVRLLVKLPLPGLTLLTVEREKVLYSQWIRVSGDAVEIELPTTRDYLPGVYIHAMTIHEEGAPFRVSRGLLYLPVEDPATRARVKVKAPEHVLPGATFPLHIETNKPQARLIIAGVDAGILPVQPRDIESPHDFFYQKRAHTVKVAEQFPYTAPWGPRVIGGGEGIAPDLPDEGSGLLPERAEQGVAFFWTEVKTDPNGAATVEVRLPPFTGRIRWRAYLLAERHFGMGEAYTTVAVPVVARLSLPLVLSEGDELLLPLTFQNTTETPQSGSWHIQLEGEGLQLSTQRGTFALPAKGKEIKVLSLRGTAPLGKVTVKLYAQDQLLQKQEVLIRPASGVRREVFSHTLQPSESLILPDVGSTFLQKRVRLIGGTIPAILYAGALWDLIQFPHGCAEQITSQAFATLTAAPWLEKLLGLSADTQIAHVKEALSQLSSMQISDGGFSYWPGGGSDPWLSVYVAHFLYEAYKAGYAEAEPLYLRAIEREKALLPLYPPQSRTQAYRALLLARVWREKVRGLFPSVAEIEAIGDPTVRSLWRGAFAQAGLPLPAPPKALHKVTRQCAEELTSTLRELALLLYAESFVPQAQRSFLIPEAQAALTKDIRALSTHETSWLLMALKQLESADPVRAEVRFGDWSRTYTEALWAEKLSGTQSVVIVNRSSRPLHVALLVEGIPKDPLPPLSMGFRLASLLQSEDKGPLAVGQRAVWTIEARLEDFVPLPLQNVALTLPLPAGCMIEPPNLGDAGFEIEGAEVIYADRRDDRLSLYLTITERKLRLKVPLRVLLSGEYAIPSVTLLAMYEPALYATTTVELRRVISLP
ncbi:MAG: MG2 domain-containing protein [Bacteroidia bacterium]|nr:MG2 domain-containing protein [Bacteroidia bacterium]